MIISFEITMPNAGSWNGKWTGSNNAHFIFRSFNKRDGEKLLQGKSERNFYYNFGDGWGANVCVKQISAKDKKDIEKINKGFMGYDWMIDSIIENDKIIA